MKSIFSLAVLLCSSLSFAQPSSEVLKSTLESQSTCQNFVRYDDNNLYLGFGGYGANEGGRVRVVTLGTTESVDFETANGAADVISEGDRLFVLTYSGIEEWSLKTKERMAVYPTYVSSSPMTYKDHAEAFARYGDMIIIAHGRLGVSFFNLKTKALVHQYRLTTWQAPLESMAAGVTVSGKYAYVAMDNFTVVNRGTPAFRGIIVIDMETLQVVSELGGMDPGADAVVSDGKSLIVSFSGMPIWKYAMKDLGGRQLPQPRQRVWKFPVDGSPTGAPSIDGKYYYTCFSKMPESGRGYFKRVPLALDRRLLILD